MQMFLQQQISDFQFNSKSKSMQKQAKLFFQILAQIKMLEFSWDLGWPMERIKLDIVNVKVREMI